MSTITRRAFITTFAVTVGLAGCASAGGGGGSTGSSSTRLTQEALADVQQLDAYQAVQRLRPQWLTRRGGTTPQVVTDGMRQPSGLEALRQYRVSEIDELRFMSASEATNRFGTGYDGGAIVVTTRR